MFWTGKGEKVLAVDKEMKKEYMVEVWFRLVTRLFMSDKRKSGVKYLKANAVKLWSHHVK